MHAALENDKNLDDDLVNHLCEKMMWIFLEGLKKRICSSHIKATDVLSGKHFLVLKKLC